MKWNQAHIFTLKEAPADAEIPSHQLLVRAGLVRKVGPGLFTIQHLLLRSLRKLETIIRKELDKAGCTEVLMPMVQPRELWEESGRWPSIGDIMLRFKNRNGHEFCLGPTHEECVTDLVRKDVKSYRDLPRNIYQIQTKYRDEIRPRFGLMRGREFIMKDAYSFDVDRESALKSYDAMYAAYQNIFKKTGLNFRIVQADAGNIGGSQTHEFQVLAQAGEDHLMVCDQCDFAANIEVAPAISALSDSSTSQTLPLEKFSTPNLKTIADLSQSLKIAKDQLVKTLFFKGQRNDGIEESVAILLAGDVEVNPIKLKNELGFQNPPEMLSDEQVRQLTGAAPGSCGPVGLKVKIYADLGLKSASNFIVGANEDHFHLKNVNFDRDFKVQKFADLRLAQAGDVCPNCNKGHYQSLRGIEVGHVFYLGTKYSQSMKAHYLSAQGESLPIEMGCYGIGVTRTLQAAIEQNHDKDGIVWPAPIAPFDVHICVLDPQSALVQDALQKICSDLDQAGLEYLVDDREERPGIKFKDADLLGMPIRINLGDRGLQQGQVEIITRKTKAKSTATVAVTCQTVVGVMKELGN